MAFAQVAEGLLAGAAGGLLSDLLREVTQTMTDTHSESIAEKVRSIQWRPLAPIALLLLGYVIWMPRYGNPSFFELMWHQQIIAASALPTIFGSLYWFLDANGKLESKTPEERVLGDE